jgi:DNA polymerase III alpha subunit
MPNVVYPCGCQWNIVDPAYKSDDDLHASPGDALPLTDVDIHNVNLNCLSVWELMGSGITKGVFQFESSLGRHWSKAAKPTSLEDMGALNALLRPGCLRARSGTPPKSMTERYVDRKNGKELVTYLTIHIESVLKATYGVLAYQEQAMRMAVKLAGFNEQEADILRKAIGKKKADIMAQVEEGFLKGCKECGLVSEEEAKEIFGWIRESQKYSFNKSHAVGYGKNAYWSAYCKAHFPVEFFTSYIIGASWKSDKYEEIAQVVNDAKLYGTDVMLPEFFDLRPYAQIKDRKIRMGLQELRDVGDAAQAKIYKGIKDVSALLGKEPINWTWLEYLVYYSPTISKTHNEALIYCGALDYFKKNRREMLFEYTQWNENVKDKEQQWVAETWDKDWHSLIDIVTACSVPGKFQFQTIDNKRTRVRISGGGASNVKRGAKLEDVVKVLKTPGQELDDAADFLAWAEEKYFGISLTCNAVDGREESISANTTCKEYMNGHASDYMVFAVQINNVQHIVTKNGKNPGQKMARLTISDSSCAVDDVICFPEVFKKCASALYEGNTVLIQGEKTSRGSLSIKKAKEI